MSSSELFWFFRRCAVNNEVLEEFDNAHEAIFDNWFLGVECAHEPLVGSWLDYREWLGDEKHLYRVCRKCQQCYRSDAE